MSNDIDQTQTNEAGATVNQIEQDELSVLKARATQIGLQFHPSIGLEKLREKVAAALASDGPVVNDEDTDKSDEAESQDTPEVSTSQVAAAPVVESVRDRRARLIKEANRLVRIRVSCMNPAKKEWEGELFTVGNGSIGTFKKFVPFNNEEGYHVPHVILQQMQERQCQIFTQGKDDRGNKIRVSKLIKEFAIEILDPLTVEELEDLAQRQAMANGTSR